MTEKPAISGSTRLRSASFHHSSWSSCTFSGMLGSDVLGLGEVLRQVEQLPTHVAIGVEVSVGPERRQRLRREVPREPVGRRRRPPAVLVHAPAREHLEVLRRVALGRRRRRPACTGSSCRPSAPARCRRPSFGSGIPAASRIVGPTSITCVNCERITWSGSSRDGHEITMGSRVPPRWLAVCFPHWNGVLQAWAHAAAMCGAVWSPPRASRPPYCSISSVCCAAIEDQPVEERQLVERAGVRALEAGAVVAPDEDDQRVVEVAHLLDLIEQPADVPVGVLLVAGVDLHLSRVQLLRRIVERIPRREGIGPLGQLGVLRHDSELLLPLERPLRAARPSRRRTCPGTCRPTPSGRGAGRARSRWSRT